MQNVVSNVLSGLDDPWEKLAFLFADGTAREARGFVLAQEMDRKLIALRESAVLSARELESATEEYESRKKELHDLKAKSGSWLLGGVAFLGLLVSGVAAVIMGAPVVGGPLIGAWLILMIILGKRSSSQSARRMLAERAVDRAARMQQEKLGISETRRADLAALERTRMEQSPRRSLHSITTQSIRFRRALLAGYPVVVEETRILGESEFRLPDFGSTEESVRRIQAAVARAEERPVLLEADEESAGAISDLHGEERSLREAVDEFVLMADRVPVVHEKARLIPNNSPVHARIPRAGVGPAGTGGSEEISGALARVVGRLRIGGRDAILVYRETLRRLEGILTEYRGMRANALQSVHRHLLEAMDRAELPSVRFYCPHCCKVPRYIYRCLGVPLESAHEMDLQELYDRILGNEGAAARLEEDQSVLKNLCDASTVLREVGFEREALLHASGATPSDAGAFPVSTVSQANRLRELDDQWKNALADFRGSVRHALTGHRRPLLNLPSVAVLRFEPDVNTWTCGVCNREFEDWSVAETGRMLRVKDDLIFPMWRALWTEKDDLRKSETARTAEQLLGLKEKESEKIKDIAMQYTDDMRPVRENLIRASAEAENKREQLVDTMKGLAVLNLVSAVQLDEVIRTAEADLGTGIADHKRHAEAKELLLRLEPISQQQRRPAVFDPVDRILEPETLFRETMLEEGRAFLPGPRHGDPDAKDAATRGATPAEGNE